MKSRSNTVDVYHRYYLNKDKFNQIKAEIINSCIKSSKNLYSHEQAMEDTDNKK
jgi:hypothetical protein